MTKKALGSVARGMVFVMAGALADPSHASASHDWLGFSGNFELGYRRTQFFEDHHDTSVGLGDARLELWLPPHKRDGATESDDQGLSWGLYLRLAGIAASQDQPWENAWLAAPGAGLQVYPFSLPTFRKGHDNEGIGNILGPLRLFVEYNRMDYGGGVNAWRPDRQVRAGADYWRDLGVNRIKKPWWAEIWGGLYYQSANEFDSSYDALTLAGSVRAGVRFPFHGDGSKLLSMISPYAVVETSVNGKRASYWENRLLVGGGLALTPSADDLPTWLGLFTVYAEYDGIAAYYYDHPPASVPNHDFRVGINFAMGDWFMGSQ